MGATGSYAREAARALMRLRRESVRSVCTATGIGETTLKWFLERGVDEALSDESFAALFAHLGVVATQAGPKLAPGRVHYLHVSGAPFARAQDVKMFRTLAPLLGAASGLELPAYKGVAPILVRGGETRVALLVRVGFMGRARLSKLGLLEGAHRDAASAASIPKYCFELLVTKQVRRNYFDLILQGDCELESIELLRMAALDRDVTLEAMLADLMGRGGQGPHERQSNDDTAAQGASVLALAPEHFARRAA